MVLENLVIPCQINNKIKRTIVRLSSVASQIVDNEYPRHINSIFAASISISASIGSRMKNDGVFSFQAHSEGVIKTIFVDEGVTLKRIQPAPQGRAHRINKRSCHITVVVAKREKELVNE